MRPLLLIALIVLVGLGGCKKYEEGPLISYITKKARIVNEWQIDRVNSNLFRPNFYINIIEIKEDNTFIFKVSHIELIEGSWSFEERRSSVSFNWNTANALGGNGFSRLDCEILRLKENELWLIDKEDGSEYRFNPI